MGMTGSGKSTFISRCAVKHVQIGHDLQSCKLLGRSVLSLSVSAVFPRYPLYLPNVHFLSIIPHSCFQLISLRLEVHPTSRFSLSHTLITFTPSISLIRRASMTQIAPISTF